MIDGSFVNPMQTEGSTLPPLEGGAPTIVTQGLEPLAESFHPFGISRTIPSR